MVKFKGSADIQSTISYLYIPRRHIFAFKQCTDSDVEFGEHDTSTIIADYPRIFAVSRNEFNKRRSSHYPVFRSNIESYSNNMLRFREVPGANHTIRTLYLIPCLTRICTT